MVFKIKSNLGFFLKKKKINSRLKLWITEVGLEGEFSDSHFGFLKCFSMSYAGNLVFRVYNLVFRVYS